MEPLSLVSGTDTLATFVTKYNATVQLLGVGVRLFSTDILNGKINGNSASIVPAIPGFRFVAMSDIVIDLVQVEEGLAPYQQALINIGTTSQPALFAQNLNVGSMQQALLRLGAQLEDSLDINDSGLNLLITQPAEGYSVFRFRVSVLGYVRPLNLISAD